VTPVRLSCASENDYPVRVDLDDLLMKTSRTFALAIPLLPEPTRREVGVAYLLFRIADTFEDATTWPRQTRLEALTAFAAAMQLPGPERVARVRALVPQWLRSPPVTHEGYLELLREAEGVVAALDQMPPAMQRVLVHHTVRTAEGMAAVVARADERGSLQLESMKDLTDYCYVVAGIVGELLTDVFVHDAPSLASRRAQLEQHMVEFGEGLQLVNILKDQGADATDGRVYLPAGVSSAELFARARRDLEAANRYVQSLQQGSAPRGFLAFCGLSLVLAFAALDRLEAEGAGAKVSRDDVARLFGRLQELLDVGGPLDLRALA
jgi:farnesyl-diphosphate farnesyltransferase